MNNARKIIEKFGGQSALASLLGKGQSTVQHWAKVGSIPSKWHGVILSIARERNVDLNPSDFIEEVTANNVPEVRNDGLPVAEWPGVLRVSDGVELPCYVLSDGRRVISRTGATDMLTEKKGGGNLESYIGIEALQNYLPTDLPGHMIEIVMPGVVNKTVRAIEAETFLDICRAYVRAREDGALQTDRQREIAKNATLFLAACSKVGLIALIDEATGFQYVREQDALQFKLKLYLEEEMRKWEPTFPDELWKEFGRLTNWKGNLHSRPKYWGKLVMELIYGYLDPDVAEWLKKNAPKPKHGQNYHQWMSSQYGLKKLIEHIWMLIGMGSACHSMSELRARMAEKYGRQPVQLTFYVPYGKK